MKTNREKKYILLTGASGFLGSKVLKKLIDNGYHVVALVRENSNLNRIKELQGKFELFILMDNQVNLKFLFDHFEINSIIHTATDYGITSSYSEVLNSNLIFPMKLVEFGLQNSLQYFFNCDTFFCKPAYLNSTYKATYTNSKKLFFDYLLTIEGALNIINLRLEHVFGEFDSNTKFVTNIFNKLMNSENEIHLTEGFQERDFIYIDDVVSAIMTILCTIKNTKDFSEYEIGTGQSISVRKFVTLMAELTKSQSKLNFGSIKTDKNEIKSSVANNKSLLDLGWRPQFDLSTAITSMINNFDRQKA